MTSFWKGMFKDIDKVIKIATYVDNINSKCSHTLHPHNTAERTIHLNSLRSNRILSSKVPRETQMYYHASDLSQTAP